MKKYCFGIDVGGTTVKCGLFTIEGVVLDKWEIPTRTENDGDQILPDIAETVLDKMKEKQIDEKQVSGLGIGLPGPVNSNGCLPYAVNLHWGFKDVEGELNELTGLTIRAANDANIAALGEMWKGGGAGAQNVLLVTLGTGVGGGVVVDGKILYGQHGAGGEIGHAHVNDDEKEPCNCGNYGCLEQYASATGIVRLAKREMKRSKDASVLREAEKITSKGIFDAMKEGDALATRVVEEFGFILGKTLSIFSCTVDPQIIVIGGGVSKAGTVLLDYIEKGFKQYAFPVCRDTEFALAMLGNDAGIYGAAKLVC